MERIIKRIQTWIPDKGISKGAEMYHNAVFNSSWYNDNLKALMDEFLSLDKENKIIVDFGAGTGVSSLYLHECIDKDSEVWLVDNSPSWLGKAYEALKDKSNVKFFILEKNAVSYDTLSDTVGEEIVDVVVSANTFHLIDDLRSAVSGIYNSLKPGGNFIFQSGNIIRNDREEGILMIDSTVEEINRIAIDIIRSDERFSLYKENIEERISAEYEQRKLIFPNPRTVEMYTDVLSELGFKNITTRHKAIDVSYDDWKYFLKVKRVQAGILPEIGGKKPKEKEIEDRDTIIDLAIDIYFDDLRRNNPFATKEKFVAEWMYIKGEK